MKPDKIRLILDMWEFQKHISTGDQTREMTKEESAECLDLVRRSRALNLSEGEILTIKHHKTKW